MLSKPNYFRVEHMTHHQTRAALKIPFPSYTITSSLFWMPRAETAAAKASSDGNICGNWCNTVQYLRIRNQEKLTEYIANSVQQLFVLILKDAKDSSNI